MEFKLNPAQQAIKNKEKLTTVRSHPKPIPSAIEAA